MKLLSIKIYPNNRTGWQSKHLFFGDRITQIYGPNGSGKTPIIQSIVYALGFPISFRNDMTENCSHVELTVQFEEEKYTIKRNIGADFFVSVKNDMGEECFFSDEKEYSLYLLRKMGFETPILLTIAKKPTTPYISTFLPLVYLDQDDGYSSVYKSPANFIKDQFSEMIRIAFGLAVKNSFTKKKDTIKAKEKLDTLDVRVVNQRRILDELKSNVDFSRKSSDLSNEIDNIKIELNELKKGRSEKTNSISSIDALIIEKRNEHREINLEIYEFEKRINSTRIIVNEIETEINTLNLNEEARRIFRSFGEICSSEKCGLFLGSAESYGKSLLYLRDQTKDLERNVEIVKLKISILESSKYQCEKEIQELANKRGQIEVSSDVSGLIEALGALTERLFELEYKKKALEQITDAENKFVLLLNERESALNIYNDLSGGHTTLSLEVARLKNEFRNKIVSWLDILHTENISRDVSIGSDFQVTFNGEKINQIKGSTRVRIILSIHAAIFEIILENQSSNLNFYILDTPKQHEMHNVDIGDYINKLAMLASEKKAQIIFSTTEYHYQCADNDKEWIPEYDGEKHKMFLSTGDV